MPHHHSTVNYVEPNDYNAFETPDGIKYSKQQPLEDMCIAMNIEVEVHSRDSQTSKSSGKDVITLSWKSTNSGESHVNFMSGTRILGEKESKGDEYNPPYLTTNPSDMYLDDLIDYGTTEMVGIKSVNVEYQSGTVPVISIKMTDVRGMSLFQPNEMIRDREYQGMKGISADSVAQSFFQCFFRAPYPRFRIYLKGFYGKPVSYEMMCDKFDTKFNSSTGDFDVDVRFIGYMYSFLTDISMDMLVACPYSDYKGKEYWEREVASGRFRIPDKDGIMQDMPPLYEMMDKYTDFKTKSNDEFYNSTGENEENTHEEQIENLKSLRLKYQNWYQTLFNEVCAKYGASCCCLIKTDGSDPDYMGVVVFVEEGASGDLSGAFSQFSDAMKELNKDLYASVDTYKSSNSEAVAIDNVSPDFADYKKTKIVNTFYVNTAGEITYDGMAQNSPVTRGEMLACMLTDDEGRRDDKRYRAIYNDGANQRVYGYCIRVDYSLLAAKINALNTSANESQKKKDSGESVKAYNRKMYAQLGYYPSVENFMKVMFAHLETFMYMMYELIKEIGERSPKSLGISVGPEGDANDIPGTSNTVAPFPRVTRKVQEDGIIRNEDAWVGDYKSGIGFKEVELVDGIFNGIQYIRENMAAKAEAERARQHDESVSRGELSRVTFPVASYDYYLGGKVFNMTSDDLTAKGYQTYYKKILLRAFGVLSASAYAKLPNFNSFAEKIGWCDAMNLYKEIGGAFNDKEFVSLACGTLEEHSIIEIDRTVSAMTNSIGDVFQTASNGVLIPKNEFVATKNISGGSGTVRGIQVEDFALKLVAGMNHKYLWFGIPKDNAWGGLNLKYSKLKIDENVDFVQNSLNYAAGNQIDKPKNSGETFESDNADADFSYGDFESVLSQEESVSTSFNEELYVKLFTTLGQKLYEWVKGGRDGDGSEDENWVSMTGQNGPFKKIAKAIRDARRKIDENVPEYDDKIVTKNEVLENIFKGSESDKLSSEITKLVNLGEIIKLAQDTNAVHFFIPKIAIPLLSIDSRIDSIDRNSYIEYAKSCRSSIYKNHDDAFTPVMVTRMSCFTSGSGYSGHPLKTETLTNYLTGFVKMLRKLNRVGYRTDEEGNITKVTESSKEVTEGMRLELYRYLKQVYDKWVPSNKFEDWKIEEFFSEDRNKHSIYFIDSYYNKIGQKIVINPQQIWKRTNDTLGVQDVNVNMLTFIADMLQTSRCMFLCIQNFYDMTDNMESTFKPIPYNDMEEPKKSPDFVVVYPYEPSKNLNLPNPEYNDDGFMLNDEFYTPVAIRSRNDDRSKCYKIPAFGVSYGRQYQSYFKDVNVGMAGAVQTQQAIWAKHQILNAVNDSGNVRKLTQAQDLFDIYTTQSYTCTVTMMGCAWIQPLMYFVLLNVPMFRGSYLIFKVSHSITPGDMTTTISACRMARTSNQLVEDIFIDISGDTGDRGYNTGGLPENYGRADTSNNCDYKVYPLTTCGKFKGDKPGPLFNGDRKGFCVSMFHAWISVGVDPDLAEVITAQDANESNYGTSTYAQYFNYGGIKSKNTQSGYWEGNSIEEYVKHKINACLSKNFEPDPLKAKSADEYFNIIQNLSTPEHPNGANLKKSADGRACTYSEIGLEYKKRIMNNFFPTVHELLKGVSRTPDIDPNEKVDVNKLLFEAIQKSVNDTDNIKVELDVSMVKTQYGFDAIAIRQKDGKRDKLGKVFGLILNGYYQYVHQLFWCYNRNVNVVTSPDAIVVVPSLKVDATLRRVGFGVVVTTHDMTETQSRAYIWGDKSVMAKTGKHIVQIKNVTFTNEEAMEAKEKNTTFIHPDFLQSIVKKYGVPEPTDKVAIKELPQFVNKGVFQSEVFKSVSIADCQGADYGGPVNNTAGKISAGKIGDWDVAASVNWLIRVSHGGYPGFNCPPGPAQSDKLCGTYTFPQNGTYCTPKCGRCWGYVKRALVYGGFDESHLTTVNACDAGSDLLKSGFVKIYRGWYAGDRKAPSDYKPQLGDITIFDKCKGHDIGHADMYCGQWWISDFKQAGNWINGGTQGGYTIYRYGGSGRGTNSARCSS